MSAESLGYWDDGDNFIVCGLNLGSIYKFDVPGGAVIARPAIGERRQMGTDEEAMEYVEECTKHALEILRNGRSSQ